MRNTISSVLIAIAVTSLATAPAVAASKASKEESIGVGSGAVIGGFAGGPLGIFVGAALGAKLGDTFARKNDRLLSLESSLDDAHRDAAALEDSVDTLSDEIDRLRNVSRPELVGLLQAGINLDLLFRTDEFALTDMTGNRLAELAGTLATLPDIRVRLDGFADERGDEEYNLALSGKRVNFVHDLLVAAGVNPDRIDASAHGESSAQDESADSYALERRVSLTLFISESPSVAANPASL